MNSTGHKEPITKQSRRRNPLSSLNFMSFFEFCLVQYLGLIIFSYGRRPTNQKEKTNASCKKSIESRSRFNLSVYFKAITERDCSSYRRFVYKHITIDYVDDLDNLTVIRIARDQDSFYQASQMKTFFQKVSFKTKIQNLLNLQYSNIHDFVSAKLAKIV